MDFDIVADRLDGIPFTTPKKGRWLYDFILENGCKSILEVGFHHGTSTCYMAAALDELQEGHILTIDQKSSREKSPSLPSLLNELQLDGYVTPIFAERSFTWELYKLLSQVPRPEFNFIFHDADHTWDTTALSFFLMDKMLQQGGWMLFDDYKWTIDRATRPSQRLINYPEEERRTPAVAEVFRLLIDEHPSYGQFTVTNNDNWGWAPKIRQQGAGQSVEQAHGRHLGPTPPRETGKARYGRFVIPLLAALGGYTAARIVNR